MIRNLSFGLALFVLTVSARSSQASDWRELAWDQLRQDYSWLVENLSRQNWEPITAFISDKTIVNNDEHGLQGVKRALSVDRCRASVIMALQQGCRRMKASTIDGELLTCNAPPQANANDVIYGGSKVQLLYSRGRNQWELRYVNCR